MKPNESSTDLTLTRAELIAQRDDLRAALAHADHVRDAAVQRANRLATERVAMQKERDEARDKIAEAFEIQNRRVQRAKDHYGAEVDRLRAALRQWKCSLCHGTRDWFDGSDSRCPCGVCTDGLDPIASAALAPSAPTPEIQP